MREVDTQTNEVLLTDGKTLKKGLDIGDIQFLSFCEKFKFVCFARCSPKQKY